MTLLASLRKTRRCSARLLLASLRKTRRCSARLLRCGSCCSDVAGKSELRQDGVVPGYCAVGAVVVTLLASLN